MNRSIATRSRDRGHSLVLAIRLAFWEGWRSRPSCREQLLRLGLGHRDVTELLNREPSRRKGRKRYER